MVWGLGLRSRLLAAAGVAIIMGAYSDAPGKAADLGGDCCSDLEERVAELEATTVRKGNKKVSVTLYGQVNKAVLWWDDGAEKNTYVVDNNYESSRFGFKGSAKIGGDWSAGYRMEIETITAQSNLVNQFNPGDDPSFGLLNVRHSYMYLDNKKWGQVRWRLTGGGGLAGFRRDIQDWAGSASIKHKPTGLFVMGTFSFSDNDDSNTKHAASSPEPAIRR